MDSKSMKLEVAGLRGLERQRTESPTRGGMRGFNELDQHPILYACKGSMFNCPKPGSNPRSPSGPTSYGLRIPITANHDSSSIPVFSLDCICQRTGDAKQRETLTEEVRSRLCAQEVLRALPDLPAQGTGPLRSPFPGRSAIALSRPSRVHRSAARQGTPSRFSGLVVYPISLLHTQRSKSAPTLLTQ